MPTRTTMAIASTSAGPRSASHRSVSRLALGGCLCVAVLGVVLLAPTDVPVLNAAAPASAEAYQGGWDRDHWWIKASAGDVARGAVAAICARYVPASRRAQICIPIGIAAKKVIGAHRGFWAEAWPPYCSKHWVKVGGRWYLWPYCVGPRFRWGVW